MEPEPIEFFVHAKGRSQVVQAPSGETLRETLIRIDVLKAGEAAGPVFIGSCTEALVEPVEADDGEDMHEPVDIDLTIEVLDLKRHRHVHHHPCRRIAVEVNFAGKTKRRRFSPAATVETVTVWARKKFRIDPASASEYALQFCGTTIQPRTDLHLSQLPEAADCKLCFDLVPEVTPQG